MMQTWFLDSIYQQEYQYLKIKLKATGNKIKKNILGIFVSPFPVLEKWRMFASFFPSAFKIVTLKDKEKFWGTKVSKIEALVLIFPPFNSEG